MNNSFQNLKVATGFSILVIGSKNFPNFTNNYDFSKQDYLKMMNNSVDVAFVDETERQVLRKELQEKFENFFETPVKQEISF